MATSTGRRDVFRGIFDMFGNIFARQGDGAFEAGIIATALVTSTVILLGTILFLRDLQRIGLAVALAAAAAAVGSLAGFIFGIPKSLQHGDVAKIGEVYVANTNLEAISDWLTKIVVGIGLIQFRAIGHALGSLGVALSPLFTPKGESPASGESFSIALVVGTSTLAFILEYIWTRTGFENRLVRGSLGRQLAPTTGSE